MAGKSRAPVIVQVPPLSNPIWRGSSCDADVFTSQLEVSYEEADDNDDNSSSSCSSNSNNNNNSNEEKEEKNTVEKEEEEEEEEEVINETSGDYAATGTDLDEEMDDIKLDDVHSLLEHFAKNTYRAKNATSLDDDILTKCHTLFSRDYHCFVITNFGGELSSHYPSKIIILEYEKTVVNSLREKECDSLYQSLYGPAKVQDLCQRARLARCRARFPVPVILLDGKHVCRSATLSGGPEIYGRSSYDFFFAGKSGGARDEEAEDEESDMPYPQTSSDWQLFDRVRSQDIKLLKLFNVSHICDLMVEKKKVKFGMNITSSEKVDKEKRYSDFSILSLPYPGCEFFQEYSLNEYNAIGLVYAWNQAFIDARLVIPSDSVIARLDIDWNSYKTWDVIKLTQNYIRLLLKYIKNATGGLLIHCISGWDRTPLFISLLRMSLWADGEIHKSLKPLEMLYLTLAYDWFLFGHNLADKLVKREEILFFCFDFLKNIEGDEFALRKKSTTLATRKEPYTRKPSDLESVPDDILIDSGNVCGSNTSLNSSCSSVSTRSQDCPPTFFTTWYDSSDEGVVPTPPGVASDGLKLHHRKTVPEEGTVVQHSATTPPVAVPAPRSTRRSDSSSSFSCGSWQIISGTGSLRGSTSTRDSLSSQTPSSDQSLPSRHRHSSFTWSEAGDGDGFHQHHVPFTRSQRLYELRKAFYHVYSSAAGFRFRSGSDASSSGGLSSLLDHFAEKVGIRTGRGSSR